MIQVVDVGLDQDIWCPTGTIMWFGRFGRTSFASLPSPKISSSPTHLSCCVLLNLKIRSHSLTILQVKPIPTRSSNHTRRRDELWCLQFQFTGAARESSPNYLQVKFTKKQPLAAIFAVDRNIYTAWYWIQNDCNVCTQVVSWEHNCSSVRDTVVWIYSILHHVLNFKSFARFKAH